MAARTSSVASIPRPDRRTGLTVLAALVALVALYAVFYVPTAASRLDAKRRLDVAERRLANANEELATVRAGDTVSAADLDAASKTASQLLPPQPQGSDDVAALWREAESRGLTVSSFSAGDPARASVTDPRLQVVNARVSVDGPLPALVAWLTALRNGPSLVVATPGPVTASGSGVSTVVEVQMYSTTAPSLADQLLAKRESKRPSS